MSCSSSRFGGLSQIFCRSPNYLMILSTACHRYLDIINQSPYFMCLRRRYPQELQDIYYYCDIFINEQEKQKNT